MRRQHALVGMLSLGLSFGTFSAFGQEPRSGDAPVAQTEATSTDDSNLPQIPMQVILRLQGNIAESQKLGLTNAQKDDLAAFIKVHNAEKNRIQLVLSSLDKLGLKSFRLQSAAKELTDEADAKAQTKVQTILTAQQRAMLRQAHRLEIQQVSFTSKPSLSAVGFGTLHQQWANGDQLSVLEIPEIQQTLLLSDEQWKRVEATNKTAYVAAREVILKGKEFAVPMISASASVPNVYPQVEQFQKEALSQLTEQQRAKFEEIVQEQRKEFQVAAKRQEIKFPADFKKLSLAFPHGGIIHMRSHVNDQGSRYEFTLNNALAHPDVVQQLGLTEEQQKTFARELQEFHKVLLTKFNENQQTSAQTESKKLEQLRELVVAHNAESQKQLADLLTPEQQATLKKECLKSLGWSALLQKDVAESLQLTAEQMSSIKSALKTPAPQMKPFTNPPGDFDAFRNRSDEFHKKMSQYHTEISHRIWEVLSSEQRQQFESMTGIRPPKK